MTTVRLTNEMRDMIVYKLMQLKQSKKTQESKAA